MTHVPTFSVRRLAGIKQGRASEGDVMADAEFEWKEVACDAVDLDEAMAQGRAYEARGYIVAVLEDGSQVYRSPMPEGVEA